MAGDGPEMLMRQMLALVVSALCVAPAALAQEEAAPAKDAAAPAAAPAAADSDLTDEGTEQREAAVDGTGRTLQERIRAVSRRAFLKEGRFELTPFAAANTNDAFFRSWALGARARYHFTEEFAVDVGGLGSPFQEELDAVRVLNAAEIDLEATSQLLGLVDVGATFTPFYGKFALMSEYVVHFDTFVSGGIGGVFDLVNDQFQAHPALQLGVGGQLFFTRWLAARVDFRNYVYPQQIGNELTFPNLLVLQAGLAFYFPFDFDYAGEQQGTKG
jgi:outer membrane beta-barrel protein